MIFPVICDIHALGAERDNPAEVSDDEGPPETTYKRMTAETIPVFGTRRYS